MNNSAILPHLSPAHHTFPPSSLTLHHSPHLSHPPTCHPSYLLPQPSPLLPNLSSFLLTPSPSAPSPLLPHTSSLLLLCSSLTPPPIPLLPHPSPLIPHSLSLTPPPTLLLRKLCMTSLVRFCIEKVKILKKILLLSLTKKCWLRIRISMRSGIRIRIKTF